MKFYTTFFFALIIAMIAGCAGNSEKPQIDDPAKTTIPGNSDATNPSLADTAYSKLKKDSVKKNMDTSKNK